MNKEDNEFKNDIDYQNFLHEVGARFHELNEMANKHGIFLYDRETVSCPQCGLTEDIAFSGKLFTYYKDDLEFKETGFQFIPLDGNAECFKCPVCNIEASQNNSGFCDE